MTHPKPPTARIWYAPTRTKRLSRDYSRLEQHRTQTLGPKTWGVLLGDSALPGGDIPLGTSGLGLENCEV